jgi:hypothetical protein
MMKKIFKFVFLSVFISLFSGCSFTSQDEIMKKNNEVETGGEKKILDDTYLSENVEAEIQPSGTEKEEREMAAADPMMASIKTLERIYELSLIKKEENENREDFKNSSFCPKEECSTVSSKNDSEKIFVLCIAYCNGLEDAEKIYSEKTNPQNYLVIKPNIGEQSAFSDSLMTVNFRRGKLFFTIKTDYNGKEKTNIEEIKYMARTIDVIMPR